jgi:soluble cytochrome b562
MGHDWLFEVLADMKAYAERHGMSALAAKIDETEAVARADVAASARESDGSVPQKPVRRGG